MAGQMWKALPVEEKIKYKQRAEELFKLKKMSIYQDNTSMCDKYPLSNFPMNLPFNNFAN